MDRYDWFRKAIDYINEIADGIKVFQKKSGEFLKGLAKFLKCLVGIFKNDN